jgi:hypothetical protein
MPSAYCRLIIRSLLSFGVLLVLAAPAAAQRPLADPPTSAAFLSRYDFHLTATALTSPDPRFSWDGHWGGDLDLVDYVHGRLSFLVDYQSLLGDELQPFDPRQGIYILEASSSVRAGGTEVAGVLHHVSRHLGDRPKEFGIAWNVIGARALRRFGDDGLAVDVRADLGYAIEAAFVDYTWTGDLDVHVTRRVSPTVSVFGRAYGEMYGVDPDVHDRSTQHGGRIEVGVHLSGSGGALQLFGGVERVIDADPFDLVPMSWAFAGFRILAR